MIGRELIDGEWEDIAARVCCLLLWLYFLQVLVAKEEEGKRNAVDFAAVTMVLFEIIMVTVPNKNKESAEGARFIINNTLLLK